MPFTTFLQRIRGKEVQEETIVMPVFEDVPEELLEEEFKDAVEELVVEELVVEEPILKEVKVLTKEELQLLSKMEIDEYAFGHGIELDRRRSKSSMINDFLTQINKGE